VAKGGIKLASVVPILILIVGFIVVLTVWRNKNFLRFGSSVTAAAEIGATKPEYLTVDLYGSNIPQPQPQDQSQLQSSNNENIMLIANHKTHGYTFVGRKMYKSSFSSCDNPYLFVAST
jgi:hypothetical protein